MKRARISNDRVLTANAILPRIDNILDLTSLPKSKKRFLQIILLVPVVIRDNLSLGPVDGIDGKYCLSQVVLQSSDNGASKNTYTLTQCMNLVPTQ